MKNEIDNIEKKVLNMTTRQNMDEFESKRKQSGIK